MSGKPNTVRRAILAILAFQIGMAIVLAGGDLMRALPSLIAPSNQPSLDNPVSPGDQTRRFRPADIPARPGNPDRVTDIPSPGNMPSRLRFEETGDAVLLTGTIAGGDAERFDEWLEGRDAPQTIRLHSPGGSVMDALAIGRTIRDIEADTLMESGDICFSACPYVLAGGATRTVDEDALVGVHQHYFDENVALPAFIAVEDIQRGQAAVVGYLSDMGIDLRIMELSLSTPPDEIYVLLPEELDEYGMTTTES